MNRKTLTALCLAIFASAVMACGGAHITPQNTDRTPSLSVPDQRTTVSISVEPSAATAESSVVEFGHIVGMFLAESPGAMMRSGEFSNCEITPMDALAVASLYQSWAV